MEEIKGLVVASRGLMQQFAPGTSRAIPIFFKLVYVLLLNLNSGCRNGERKRIVVFTLVRLFPASRHIFVARPSVEFSAALGSGMGETSQWCVPFIQIYLVDVVKWLKLERALPVCLNAHPTV